MLSVPPHPFVFGKSPRYGDFISRGLNPAQETAWDGFGAAVMARAAGHWGDSHKERHAQAPMWRFTLPPGTLAMDGWTIGALSPSMDSVGRLFLLAAGLTGAGDAAMAGAEDFADHAEDCVWQAIVGGQDKETVAAAIAGAPAPEGSGLRTRWWTAQGDENSAMLPDDLFTLTSLPPDEALS
jgi:type VI secretion system protein ImpM